VIAWGEGKKKEEGALWLTVRHPRKEKPPTSVRRLERVLIPLGREGKGGGASLFITSGKKGNPAAPNSPGRERKEDRERHYLSTYEGKKEGGRGGWFVKNSGVLLERGDKTAPGQSEGVKGRIPPFSNTQQHAERRKGKKKKKKGKKNAPKIIPFSEKGRIAT